MSDLIMIAPTVEFARYISKNSSVYMNTFNHEANHTRPSWWGVYHLLELDYVFGAPFHGFNTFTDRVQNHTKNDAHISRLVMKIWTDFAKYQ